MNNLFAKCTTGIINFIIIFIINLKEKLILAALLISLIFSCNKLVGWITGL
jgi:hypothetical protein